MSSRAVRPIQANMSSSWGPDATREESASTSCTSLSANHFDTQDELVHTYSASHFVEDGCHCLEMFGREHRHKHLALLPMQIALCRE